MFFCFFTSAHSSAVRHRICTLSNVFHFSLCVEFKVFPLVFRVLVLRKIASTGFWVRIAHSLCTVWIDHQKFGPRRSSQRDKLYAIGVLTFYNGLPTTKVILIPRWYIAGRHFSSFFLGTTVDHTNFFVPARYLRFPGRNIVRLCFSTFSISVSLFNFKKSLGRGLL